MWAFVISVARVIFYGRQNGRFFTFTFQQGYVITGIVKRVFPKAAVFFRKTNSVL
jgi:hypothetical protein